VDGPQNSYQSFTEAVSEVVEQRENGQSVLIHCSAGSSRSPSVAAAAITHLTENNLNEAFNQVIERRPETDPHDVLVRQAFKLTNQSPD
jgi:protein-tyrosine phosphatase